VNVNPAGVVSVADAYSIILAEVGRAPSARLRYVRTDRFGESTYSRNFFTEYVASGDSPLSARFDVLAEKHGGRILISERFFSWLTGKRAAEIAAESVAFTVDRKSSPLDCCIVLYPSLAREIENLRSRTAR
jgi:hypothetical protein